MLEITPFQLSTEIAQLKEQLRIAQDRKFKSASNIVNQSFPVLVIKGPASRLPVKSNAIKIPSVSDSGTQTLASKKKNFTTAGVQTAQLRVTPPTLVIEKVCHDGLIKTFSQDQVEEEPREVVHASVIAPSPVVPQSRGFRQPYHLPEFSFTTSLQAVMKTSQRTHQVPHQEKFLVHQFQLPAFPQLSVTTAPLLKKFPENPWLQQNARGFGMFT